MVVATAPVRRVAPPHVAPPPHSWSTPFAAPSEELVKFAAWPSCNDPQYAAAVGVAARQRLCLTDGGRLKPLPWRSSDPEADLFDGDTLQKKLGQKMTMSTSKERTMTFDNFVARQSLRDEAMAGASAGWLAQNPGGQMLNLVGVSHAKFGLGVQARTARMLGSPRAVASVLLNPTPINTFGGAEINNLRPCDRAAVPNEACVLNDIEVQNYVLQVPFAAASSEVARRRTDRDEAAAAMQARKGSSVLAVSDFMLFSPT